MVQLAKVYEEIKALGADIWAVSPQSVDRNKALVDKRELPFIILSDTDLAVVNEWGLFDHDDPKERSIPIPASYIVDKSGMVVWRYLGRSTRDRPEPGELLLQLALLEEQE